MKLDITKNGRAINLANHEGHIRWTNGQPPLADWQYFMNRSFSEDSLKKGSFLWVNGLNEDEVTVVFQPYMSLNFNLTYSVLSGDLLQINEAR